MTKLPRYPIYIPSKGRAEHCTTALALNKDNVPFYLVIEQQEYDTYAKQFGEKCLLVLPFNNQGSVIPARNWIKDHATNDGHLRHWQLDDNIRDTYRMWKGKRLRCNADIAFRAAEDFVDRYENVAIAGLNYRWLVVSGLPPFLLNARVYSCSLVLNSIKHKWRGRYNEDADICLQVLADGWCTILINAFMVDKETTMTVSGGNTDELYYGDGRLKMARSLERLWPRVVRTNRRFKRPQHVIYDSWKRFDTPLIKKKDVIIDTNPNEYGMKLVQVSDKIKSKKIKQLVKDYGTGQKK